MRRLYIIALILISISPAMAQIGLEFGHGALLNTPLPSGSWIGTTQAYGWTFTINPYIYTSARLGVSESSPQTSIHVAGSDNEIRLEAGTGGTGNGQLIRFTNTHTSGTTPNDGEFNVAGVKGYDYAGDWGGALGFYTAPSGTAGGAALVQRMVINPDGNVGIGTSSPLYGIHMVYTDGIALFEDNHTNNTTKIFRLGCGNYANASNPFISIYSSSGSSANVINIGGGSSKGTAATSVNIYTATARTTTTGTLRFTVGSTGLITTNSLTCDKQVTSLTDTGEYTAATGVAGWGQVYCGDEWAHFRFTTAGVVTLINNSANVGTTNDVDAKLNIYDGGSGIVIENQLGSTLNCAIELNYYTP